MCDFLLQQKLKKKFNKDIQNEAQNNWSNFKF